MSISTFINNVSQNACKNNQRSETIKKAVPDCFLSYQVPQLKISPEDSVISSLKRSQTNSS